MTKFTIAVSVVIMITIIAFTGCSPNQWATKDIVDRSDVREGETVTLLQKNGEKLSGTYVGTTTMPLEEYRNYYTVTSQRESSANFLPFYGQRIKFSTSVTNEKSWEGLLLGFSDQSLLVKFDGESSPEEIYLSSLTSMSSNNGDVIQRMKFRQSYLDGEIPLMTSFLLKSATGEVLVPINSIKGVIVHDGVNIAQNLLLSPAQFVMQREHN